MARDPKAGAGVYETETYDEGNPFAQILRGEIEVEAVFESEYALAFHDRDPKARYHVLVIPKGQFRALDDFVRRGSAQQVAGFWRAVVDVAERLGLDETGYRLIVNAGEDAHMEVPHLHVHVLGGEDLGERFGRSRGREDVGDPARSANLAASKRGFGRSGPDAREQRRGPPPL